jgi:hypothetical protein
MFRLKLKILLRNIDQSKPTFPSLYQTHNFWFYNVTLIEYQTVEFLHLQVFYNQIHSKQFHWNKCLAIFAKNIFLYLVFTLSVKSQ